MTSIRESNVSQAAVDLTAEENPDREVRLNNLGIGLSLRFKREEKAR